MRRIISLALAVLMVVSTCMLGVFTASAEGTNLSAGAGNSGANGTTGTVGATISPIAGTTGTIGASGAGTVDASYEPAAIPANALPIYTADDFAAMSPVGVYYLANDITVSKTYTFTILEGETDGFRGILYGNGKTITTSVPLFAKLNNATVRDLTIDGEIYLPDGSEIAPLASIMTGSSLYGITNKANVTAKQFVGGIVATMWNSNQFEFCFNYGEMNVRNSEVAGFAARYNDSSEDLISFRNCANFGTIGTSLDPDNTLGPSNAGGFIGWIGSNTTATGFLFENCANYGSVTSDARTGGFVGVSYAKKMIMRNCVNEGAITGNDYKPTSGNDEANRTGGFIGWIYNANGDVNVALYSCLNKGSVTTVQYGGGFVGHSNVKTGSILLENCENTGTITVASNRGGGLFGVLDGASAGLFLSFINCTNSGSVTVNGYAGGMIGASWNANGYFKNCLNTGTIAANEAVGGLCGHFRGNRVLNEAGTATISDVDIIVENCKNTGVITGKNNISGIIGRVYDMRIASFKNCENHANLSGTGDHGGILGGICNDAFNGTAYPYDNLDLTITGCLNTGNVTGSNRPGGIFGASVGFRSATLKDNVNTGDVETTGNYTGGLYGRLDAMSSATIENCLNTGNVKAVTKSGNYAGGIIGFVQGYTGSTYVFNNVKNAGNVTARGVTGGFVGNFGGVKKLTIKNSTNSGNISSTGSMVSGGNNIASGFIASNNAPYEFENLVNEGTVSIPNISNVEYVDRYFKTNANGDLQVDAATGFYILAYETKADGSYNFDKPLHVSTDGDFGLNASGTKISKKVAKVTMYGNTNGRSGGMIGKTWSAGSIKNCLNTGNITTALYAGGFAGYLGANATIENCTNLGNVTAFDFAAGIVPQTAGETSVTVKKCVGGYATLPEGKTQPVITAKLAGGLLGKLENKKSTILIENCVNYSTFNNTAWSGAGIAAEFYCNGATVTVQNCTNYGSSTTGFGTGGVLGAVGAKDQTATSFTVKNCVNNGSVSGAMLGGIISRAWVVTNGLKIENCINNADLRGTANTAGILSSADTDSDNDVSVSFTNCVNTGNISSTAEKAGGMYARGAGAVKFENCINTGNITCPKETGGLLAYTAANDAAATNVYTNCINTGNVHTTGNFIIGGIAGNARKSATFTNCVNAGEVKGTTGTTGGIVADCGENKGGKAFVFESCVNLGDVSSNVAANCGGIVGYGNAGKSGVSVKNCLIMADVINAGRNVSCFVGYMNSCEGYSEIKNNVYVGKLDVTGTPDGTHPNTILMGYRSSSFIGGVNDVTNNYYFLTEGSKAFTGLHYSQNMKQYVEFDTTKNHLMTSATEDVTAKTGMNGFTYVAADKAIALPGTTVTLSGNVPTAIVTLLSGNTLPTANLTTTTFITATDLGATATGANVTVTAENTGSVDAVRGGEIDSEEDFLAMLPGGNYVLTGDITLSTSYALPFNGTLDGDGHTITVSNNAPVFKYLSGTVKNLTIDGSISLPETLAVGALAYKGAGFTLENVTNDADVEALAFAAGLVGLFFGKVTLTDCVNNGAIVSGKWEAAGLIAKGVGCDTYMTGCVNNGTVTVNSGNAGGILGYIEQAHGFSSFINCTNNGAIVAANPAGIVSNAAYGKVLYFENCVNNAAIGTREVVTTTAGGIMSNQGLNGAIIDLKDCANHGTVIGANQVGGLLGWSRGYHYINGCSNTATVISTGNYAGGIAGRTATNDDKINGKALHNPQKVHYYTNCFNSGEVIAHRQNAGGILSMTMDSASFINCTNTGYIHGEVIDAAEGTTCKVNGCHDNNNVLQMSIGGIAGSVNFEGTFYYCKNSGDLVSNSVLGGIAGRVGTGTTNQNTVGPTGYNAFIACYTDGDLYHNGLNSTAATHAFGGIVGYTRNDSLTKALLVQYCGVAGTLKADMYYDTTAKTVGGLVGYANSNYPVIENNYVIATFDVSAGTRVAATYNAYQALINLDRLENNFIIEGQTTIYADALAGAAPVTDDHVVTVAELNDGVLLDKLNAIIGTEAFVLGSIVEGGASIPMLDPSKLSVSLVPEAITSAEEFLAMNPYGNYYLATDIELNTSYPVPFCGIFDGKDHTVTTTAPLFKTTDGATISDLTIKGNIFVTQGTVAALVSEAANTTVSGITNNATISNAINNTAVENPLYFTAGIIGTAEGTVTVSDCRNNAKLEGSAVSGIVGAALNATLTITDCVNSGVLAPYSIGSTEGGGILAFATQGTITISDCINTGAISFANTNKFASKVGGIVGMINSTNANTTITNCVNGAPVIGGDQTGGIMGWSKSPVTIIDCVNFANITSVFNYAGGIVARMDAHAVFTNCLNYGKVTAHRQYSAGMLAYSPSSAIFTGCLNTGDITSDNPYATGTCTDAGCHNNTNDRYLISGGIGGSVNEARIYACANTGNITANLVGGGIIGRINGRISNDFEILYCVNTGTVLSTATRADQAWETSGGIFGFAKENDTGSKITVAYTANLGDVILEGGKGQCLGAIGSWMGKDSVMKFNYFAGTLTNNSTTTVAYGLGQNTNAALTVAGNFFIDSFTAPYYCHKPSSNTTVQLTDNEKFSATELTDGTLLDLLNTAAGEDVFVVAPELNVPVHKDVLDVLALADVNIGDYIPEDALPVPAPEGDDSETTVPGDETTAEPDDSTTEPDDSTTEPDDSTTEPDDSTTEPDGDITTEPDGDTTTQEPGDSTTEPDDPATGDKGCGSMIGASAAIIALALVAPAAMLLKKKDEE